MLICLAAYCRGGGRPFGLERLLAIFYSILIDPVRPTAELLSQIR